MNEHNVDLCMVINNLVDISHLPNAIFADETLDCAFIPSTWSPEFDYIPERILNLIEQQFSNTEITLVDAGLDESSKLFSYESANKLFKKEIVDEFINKTGLQFLIIYFKLDGSFIVGLDLDFLLIFSIKNEGFISRCGGVGIFRSICQDMFSNGESGMDEKVFKYLNDAVYCK